MRVVGAARHACYRRPALIEATTERIAIGVDSVSCNDPDYDAETDYLSGGESPDEIEQELVSEDGDELNEWGGGVCLCRWPMVNSRGRCRVIPTCLTA